MRQWTIYILGLILWSSCSGPFTTKRENLVNPRISNSYYYNKTQKAIYYSPKGNWFELGYDKTSADFESFQPLSEDYGKDNKNIFFKALVLSNVDYKTFYIDKNIPKDSFHVYENVDDKGLSIIPNADPATFEYIIVDMDTIVTYRWAKDKKHYFLWGQPINVDYSTFKILNSNFMQDSRGLYTTFPGDSFQLLDSSQGTVRLITPNYVLANNSLYYSQRPTGLRKSIVSSSENIKVLNDGVICIDSSGIFCGKKLQSVVDIKSFTGVGYDKFSGTAFSKDRFKVFYQNLWIKNADANTFTWLGDDYGKDLNHVYYKERIVEGANPKTFNFDWDFCTDGNHKYKNGVLVK